MAQLGVAGPGIQVLKGERQSVYRVTEIIGTSETSWEEAAAEAIKTAAGTIRDVRATETGARPLQNGPVHPDRSANRCGN